MLSEMTGFTDLQKSEPDFLAEPILHDLTLLLGIRGLFLKDQRPPDPSNKGRNQRPKAGRALPQTGSAPRGASRRVSSPRGRLPFPPSRAPGSPSGRPLGLTSCRLAACLCSGAVTRPRRAASGLTHVPRQPRPTPPPPHPPTWSVGPLEPVGLSHLGHLPDTDRGPRYSSRVVYNPPRGRHLGAC